MICALILASSPLAKATNLRVQEGRPIVDGVYVNGHGPYLFLIDTGTNVNLIDANLARSIGLNATFQVDLGSADGTTSVPGSDGNEVALGTVKAEDQKFLFSQLGAIHDFSSDIQGVLGQWFLAQFDYTIDLQNKRLEFGKRDRDGIRVPLRMMNARLAVSTNLGDLILDSGASRLILFGAEPDTGRVNTKAFRTVIGSERAGTVFINRLVIAGQAIWIGDAVAIPNQAEPGAAGLLPLSFFKAVYVCNSEGYVVLD